MAEAPLGARGRDAAAPKRGTAASTKGAPPTSRSGPAPPKGAPPASRSGPAPPKSAPPASRSGPAPPKGAPPTARSGPAPPKGAPPTSRRSGGLLVFFLLVCVVFPQQRTPMGNGIFSQDKLQCAPVQLAGQVLEGSVRFPGQVPEGSDAVPVWFPGQVPDGSDAVPQSGSRRFRCRRRATKGQRGFCRRPVAPMNHRKETDI